MLIEAIRRSLIASDEAFSSPERTERAGAFLARRAADFSKI